MSWPSHLVSIIIVIIIMTIVIIVVWLLLLSLVSVLFGLSVNTKVEFGFTRKSYNMAQWHWVEKGRGGG